VNVALSQPSQCWLSTLDVCNIPRSHYTEAPFVVLTCLCHIIFRCTATGAPRRQANERVPECTGPRCLIFANFEPIISDWSDRECHQGISQ